MNFVKIQDTTENLKTRLKFLTHDMSWAQEHVWYSGIPEERMDNQGFSLYPESGQMSCRNLVSQ